MTQTDTARGGAGGGGMTRYKCTSSKDTIDVRHYDSEHVRVGIDCSSRWPALFLSNPDAIAFAGDVLAAAGAAPALDVEACARDIAGAIPSWYYGADSGMDYMDALRAILRRHALPAAPRAVVALRDDDFAAACGAAGVPMGKINYVKGADRLNEFLRARATTTAAPVSSSVADAPGSVPAMPRETYEWARLVGGMECAAIEGDTNKSDALFDRLSECIGRMRRDAFRAGMGLPDAPADGGGR